MKKLSLISIITLLLLSGCSDHHEEHGKNVKAEEKPAAEKKAE